MIEGEVKWKLRIEEVIGGEEGEVEMVVVVVVVVVVVKEEKEP